MRMPPLAVAVALVTTAAAMEPAPPPPDGWAHELKLGAFISDVASYRAANSNDPSISSTHDTVAYQASGDGKVAWTRGLNQIEDRLTTRFGRAKVEGSGWQDSADEIEDDAIYRRFLGGPHFLYASVRGETVYTGPDPDNDPFDPFLGKASAGYGQRWRKVLPAVDEDLLEGRVGVRAQKRWGNHLSDIDRDPQYGPEALVRYDAKRTQFWTLFVQYEAFAEFDDLGHITQLGTGGIDVQLARYLTLRVAARAYYESRPHDAPGGQARYDHLSGKTESLLGLTYLF